jgi:hypothetical protein
MYKIFLSHASADKKQVIDHFIEFLKLGLDIRYKDIFTTSEKDKLNSGDQYVDKIKASLVSSEVMIMLISKNYMNSPFCICELGAAWVLDIPTIPILVDVDYNAVVYPNTPYRSTHLRELTNRDDLLTIAQELKNMGVAEEFSYSQLVKQLDMFLEKTTSLRQSQKKRLTPLVGKITGNPFLKENNEGFTGLLSPNLQNSLVVGIEKTKREAEVFLDSLSKSVSVPKPPLLNLEKTADNSNNVPMPSDYLENQLKIAAIKRERQKYLNSNIKPTK